MEWTPEMTAAWGLAGPAQRLGEGANHVFRVAGAIVRWSDRRPGAMVDAELDFVRHVAQRVRVALPRPTTTGMLRVPFGGGQVVVFEIAPGHIPESAPVLHPEVIRSWGAHLAGLHDAAEGWRGARPHWRDDRWWDLSLVRDDRELLRAVETLLDRAPDEALLACHADHGPQNFHWDGRRITSFDFDNLVFQPVGLDLAVPWSILAHQPDTEHAWATFDTAYRAHRPLDVSKRPLWLALRAVYVLFSRLDLWTTPTEEQTAFIARFRERVMTAAARCED